MIAVKKGKTMDTIAQDEIIHCLIENTGHIIVTILEEKTEKFVSLACRQKTLMNKLEDSSGPDRAVSVVLLTKLNDLLEKAIEATCVQMGANRSSLIATGIKKKVLEAYGTVTVSSLLPEERFS